VSAADHPADHRPAEVRTLAEQIPRFMRLIHAYKAQAAFPGGRDRAALVLLFPLARVTAGWSDGDLADLTRLFGRLLDDLSAALPAEPGPAAASLPTFPTSETR
jgi:hypothetical protein